MALLPLPQNQPPQHSAFAISAIVRQSNLDKTRVVYRFLRAKPFMKSVPLTRRRLHKSIAVYCTSSVRIIFRCKKNHRCPSTAQHLADVIAVYRRQTDQTMDLETRGELIIQWWNCVHSGRQLKVRRIGIRRVTFGWQWRRARFHIGSTTSQSSNMRSASSLWQSAHSSDSTKKPHSKWLKFIK